MTLAESAVAAGREGREAGRPAGTVPAPTGDVAPPALRHHTTTFVQRVARLTGPLIGQRPAAHAATQARQAATAAAGHYRAACQAPTTAVRTTAFRAAVEALEESLFWLQLLRLMDVVPAEDADVVLGAGADLLALMGYVETTHGPA
jgi:hypothetical protein